MPSALSRRGHRTQHLKASHANPGKKALTFVHLHMPRGNNTRSPGSNGELWYGLLGSQHLQNQPTSEVIRALKNQRHLA